LRDAQAAKQSSGEAAGGAGLQTNEEWAPRSDEAMKVLFLIRGENKYENGKDSAEI
jgi:hypothetical protein